MAVGSGMCLDPAVITRVCSPNNSQEAGVSPPGPPSRAPSLPNGDPCPTPGSYSFIQRNAQDAETAKHPRGSAGPRVVWCCRGAGWDRGARGMGAEGCPVPTEVGSATPGPPRCFPSSSSSFVSTDRWETTLSRSSNHGPLAEHPTGPQRPAGACGAAASLAGCWVGRAGGVMCVFWRSCK